MKRTILLTCVSVLCGCADVRQAPYQRPDAPTKSSWSRTEAPVSAAATVSPRWWQEFRDPELDTLVTRAIAGNFDLKILASRIEVANAQVAEVRAGALPSVDIGAGGSFEKTSRQRFSKQFS